MASPLPIPILHLLVVYGIGIILFAIFARVIASWFRIDERFAIVRFLAYLTDPFLLPIRRFVPPVGFLDMSWIIATFMLQTVQILLLQSLPATW